jgi:hypothetical protein
MQKADGCFGGGLEVSSQSSRNCGAKKSSRAEARSPEESKKQTTIQWNEGICSGEERDPRFAHDDSRAKNASRKLAQTAQFPLKWNGSC